MQAKVDESGIIGHSAFLNAGCHPAKAVAQCFEHGNNRGTEPELLRPKSMTCLFTKVFGARNTGATYLEKLVNKNFATDLLRGRFWCG